MFPRSFWLFWRAVSKRPCRTGRFSTVNKMRPGFNSIELLMLLARECVEMSCSRLMVSTEFKNRMPFRLFEIMFLIDFSGYAVLHFFNHAFGDVISL